MYDHRIEALVILEGENNSDKEYVFPLMNDRYARVDVGNDGSLTLTVVDTEWAAREIQIMLANDWTIVRCEGNARGTIVPEEAFDDEPIYGDADYEEDDDFSEFADPGGNSSLYAATPNNPRVFPCPTCGRPNKLTQKDVDARHQCDTCADEQEKGY